MRRRTFLATTAGVLGSFVGEVLRVSGAAEAERAHAHPGNRGLPGPFDGTLLYPKHEEKASEGMASPDATAPIDTPLAVEFASGIPLATAFADCAWPWNQMWAGYPGAYIFLPSTGPLTPALLGNTSWTIEISAASGRTGSQCAIGQNALMRIAENASGQAIAVLAGVPGSPVLNSGVRIDDGAMHSLCLICVYAGAGPSTFLFAVDGVVRNVTTGTWAPGTSTAFIGNGADGTWYGFLREARVSSVARYGASASTGVGTVLFAPATLPFVQDASTVALYHLAGDASDSGSNPAPPSIGAISIATALGNDVIAYPAPLQGANPVRAVQLYRGTTRGAETLFSTNAGGGAGSFTVPTAPPGQCYWYYVVAVDSTSTASAASNRVNSGLNGQGRNYQWSPLQYYAAGPFPGTQAGFFQGYGAIGSSAVPPLGELYAGNSCTFEFWMNTVQSNGTVWLHVDGRPSIYIFLQSGYLVARLPQLSGTPLTLSGAQFVADGDWHHVAVTVQAGAQVGNASLLSLWIDGHLNAQATAVFAPISHGEALGGILPRTYVGLLAELSVSTVAQYTAPFTPPNAPFLNRRANQIMLLHLNGSVMDSNGQVDPPYPPIISVTAAGGFDTVLYAAASGPAAMASYALYEGPTPGGEGSAPVATNTGAAPGRFVRPSAAGGAARYYYVTATDVNGLTSGPSNEVWAPGAGLTIYPDSAALVYSPGNWHLSGSGSSAVAVSNNPGAYVRTIFTGRRLTLLFNTANNQMPFPRVTVRIDGQPWSSQIVGSAINVTPELLLQDAIHLLELEFDACSDSGDRWNTPVEAVYFTGLVIDAGHTVMPPPARPKRVLIFGDSITEGYGTIPRTAHYAYSGPFGNSSLLDYAQLLRDLLNAEVGVVAFSGQGVVQPMYANYGPNLQRTYGYYYNGVARSFANVDMAVILMGPNDAAALGGGQTTPAAIQAGMASILSGLLAANAAMTVAVLRPLTNMPQVQAAYQAAALAAGPRVHWIDTTGFIDPSTDLQPDGIHPLAAAQLGKLAPELAAALQPVLYPG